MPLNRFFARYKFVAYSLTYCVICDTLSDKRKTSTSRNASPLNGDLADDLADRTTNTADELDNAFLPPIWAASPRFILSIVEDVSSNIVFLRVMWTYTWPTKTSCRVVIETKAIKGLSSSDANIVLLMRCDTLWFYDACRWLAIIASNSQ